MKSISGRRTALLVVGVVSLAAPMFFPRATAAAGPSTTSHVAYVYDSSIFPGSPTARGISDPALPGGSIFEAAVTGSPLGTGDVGTYKGYTFTNLTLSQLDTLGAVPPTYDTVVMYELCAIGAAANSSAETAINNFLNGGGKVLIYDADACASTEHGTPDYSHFVFPFTSNNPGAAGAVGHYTSLEASTLNAGISATYNDANSITVNNHVSDAMGDANVFVTNSGSWCKSVVGVDQTTTGIVRAYARTSAGGLAIFEGEDNWFTYGATTHLATLFNDSLAQQWNPDALPCTATASGITLTPASQTLTTGSTAKLTATVTDVNGHPSTGTVVTFSVTSGPDGGKTGTGTTDGSGHATFSLTGNSAGTDDVVAKFSDTSTTVRTRPAVAAVHSSNTATVTFTGAGTGPTPTPTAAPVGPVTGVITPDTGSAGGDGTETAGAGLFVLGLVLVGWALLPRRPYRGSS